MPAEASATVRDSAEPAAILRPSGEKALLIDGQNNHDYKATTPHLKKVIEETGLFTVDIATTPKGKDLKEDVQNLETLRGLL